MYPQLTFSPGLLSGNLKPGVSTSCAEGDPEKSTAVQTSEEYEAVETLLKGKEIELPNGQSFFDKDGNARHNVRVRWEAGGVSLGWGAGALR